MQHLNNDVMQHRYTAISKLNRNSSKNVYGYDSLQWSACHNTQMQHQVFYGLTS